MNTEHVEITVAFDKDAMDKISAALEVKLADARRQVADARRRADAKLEADFAAILKRRIAALFLRRFGGAS